jgi:hypothetical protein
VTHPPTHPPCTLPVDELTTLFDAVAVSPTLTEGSESAGKPSSHSIVNVEPVAVLVAGTALPAVVEIPAAELPSRASATVDSDDSASDSNDEDAVESEGADMFAIDMCVERPPLRAYQHRIVSTVETRMAKHFDGDSSVSSLLVYLPTGGGKTRIAAEVFRTCMADKRRCLFVVNRNKLATQVC